MTSYQQALDLIRQKARRGAEISVPLSQALGRVTTQLLAAPFAAPGFDNSAMDGFALRRAESLSATPEKPVHLPVQSLTAAGDKAGVLPPGSAAQIMTGAPVPAGADAVVAIESVEVTRDSTGKVISIALASPPKEKQNIRFIGEDFSKGSIIAKPGTRLTPHHIMALATMGIGAVPVAATPEIFVLATGNELHESGARGESGIYNSNSPYLLAMCQQAGLAGHYCGIVPDTPGDFVKALERIAMAGNSPRIILSTGAVSKGDFDFVPAALQMMKAETVFHRVAIKPGKPILFALLPNGDAFFGFPGNPGAAAIGFRFFMLPLLREIIGLPPEEPIRAILSNAHETKTGLRQFLKARLDIVDGKAQATILRGQEAFKINPLLNANGWIILDEETVRLEAGASVAFVPAAPWGFA